MRRFLLSNTLNTRDLGGYAIDCGKVTAYKVVNCKKLGVLMGRF